MKHLHLYLAGIAALSLAACSSNDAPDAPVQDGDNTENSEFFKTSLKVSRGDNSRVSMIADAQAESRGTDPNAVKNWQRLTYLGSINSDVDDINDNVWSATSVVVNDGKLIVTWHSNRQASNAALKWGGAVEEYAFAGSAISQSYSAVSDRFKFNHAAVADGNIYLAATDAKSEGSIVKLSISTLETVADYSLSDCFSGFPASVNAVVPDGDKVWAISGYQWGGLGYVTTFPNQWHINQTDKNGFVTFDEAQTGEFGGKFLTKDATGNIWALYDTKAAKVKNLTTGTVINLGVALVSGSDKYAESFDYTTGEWTLGGEKSTHYGKHTFAVDANYIYVGAGESGFCVFNHSGEKVWSNGTNTVSVAKVGDKIYTTGGAGLRIYSEPAIDSEGNLDLARYAYEVNAYGADGKPTTSDAAAEGAGLGHSANFVAVSGNTVFVAYGQDGIKVFNLNTAD